MGREHLMLVTEANMPPPMPEWKRAVEPRTIRIDFCCNDPDDGSFAGIVVGASFMECDLEPANYDYGYRFTLMPKGIRLHRRVFPHLGRKEWVGNWCWDSFLFDRAVGVRLLLTLREKGWRCTGGPTRLYDWFNGPEVS